MIKLITFALINLSFAENFEIQLIDNTTSEMKTYLPREHEIFNIPYKMTVNKNLVKCNFEKTEQKESVGGKTFKGYIICDNEKIINSGIGTALVCSPAFRNEHSSLILYEGQKNKYTLIVICK
jgi:hypothetical protein